MLVFCGRCERVELVGVSGVGLADLFETDGSEGEEQFVEIDPARADLLLAEAVDLMLTIR